MRYQPAVWAAVAATAGLALVACSPGRAADPAPGSPRPSALGGAAAGEPQTAAAVRADAGDYLSLYSAGQYAITYQMLSAPARQRISEQAWVAVHHGCPASGNTFQITRVIVTGRTASVTASLPGTAQPERETLVYANGHWGFSPRDQSLYQHGSIAADVAAAHAQGGCAS